MKKNQRGNPEERHMTLLSPDAVAPVKKDLEDTLAALDRMLLGRPELHRLVLAGILARGHVLLEGLPGLGKTALIRALAQILDLDFKRIQFTPDLMPSDILGSHILETGADGKREMSFKPGPVFCNLLLADEINRASPKTQSAMLETMQERTVTLMGVTRPLPDPFFVLASQNPIELEGTYPLPEAQTDRFIFKLLVDPPDASTLTAIITTRSHGDMPESGFTLRRESLARALETVGKILLPEAVADWIGRIVAATHGAEHVTCGASPRAAIAMAESARALALMDGRPSVGFDDVRKVAFPVLNHRLILDYRAKLDGISPREIVDKVLESTPVAE